MLKILSNSSEKNDNQPYDNKNNTFMKNFLNKKIFSVKSNIALKFCKSL